MRKIILIFTVFLLVTTISAQDYSQAKAEKIQGYYIFAKSQPVLDYEHLGTIKGPTFGNHEFDKLVETFIKKAKKKYPNGDALVFDGVIRQTHNTKVSVIKFKN